MSLSLVTPPAFEPVTLAEAKTHLKIDTTDEDALIASLITAARARAEWHTGRAFVPQSWRFTLDLWPQANCAEIPLPPLLAVTSVTVIDKDGIRTVLDPPGYRVDAACEPGRVMLPKRPAHLRASDGLEIAFTAGYGEAVPEAIRQAILQIVADLYSHRGDEALVSCSGQVLLAPYRIFKL